MDERELHFHYVCTLQEAHEIIKIHNKFWVSNCGCRERQGQCSRSRSDVCLFFKPDMGGTGSGLNQVSATFVDGILKEAEKKNLVPRPFRDTKDKTQAQGICFCCDDCCEYFISPVEIKCNKGKFIEQTDLEDCNNCGTCVDVCNFQARKMFDNRLILDRNNCYGCGICIDTCPSDCIQMIQRQ